MASARGVRRRQIVNLPCGEGCGQPSDATSCAAEGVAELCIVPKPGRFCSVGFGSGGRPWLAILHLDTGIEAPANMSATCQNRHRREWPSLPDLPTTPNKPTSAKWTKPTVANGTREAHAGSDSRASRAPNGWFHTAALRSQHYPGDTGF